MALMAFMEAMSSSSIPLLAAFFIGLMTAISPCPLATNITAIAYASKKIGDREYTLLVGFLYTLGRMFSYVLIAFLIVWFGINTQTIALFLKQYGDKLLGPFLIVIGVVMLDVVKLNVMKSSNRLNNLKEKLATKGYLGCFLLGAVFALAFCPFSGVLYFGMLIPLALKAGDAFFIPAVFAIATGLPVIIFSILLVSGMSKLGKVMNKIQIIEKWMRTIAAITFIIVGLYYTKVLLFN